MEQKQHSNTLCRRVCEVEVVETAVWQMCETRVEMGQIHIDERQTLHICAVLDPHAQRGDIPLVARECMGIRGTS